MQIEDCRFFITLASKLGFFEDMREGLVVFQKRRLRDANRTIVKFQRVLSMKGRVALDLTLNNHNSKR